MHFSTPTALLLAAWGLGLSAAAPSPSPTESATSTSEDSSSSSGWRAQITLPAGITGTLQVRPDDVKKYAEEHGLHMPEAFDLALALAPNPLFEIDAGEATCDDPLQLPADSGLSGKLCGPEGFVPTIFSLLLPSAGGAGEGTKALKGRGVCGGDCYTSCVQDIQNGDMPRYHQ
ncbi:hypothetical protein F4810DRAFT_711013 [Camillea tinctor]|nr:hypothetical protein F4810DRAFT_711013 [Camillea tinctor]